MSLFGIDRRRASKRQQETIRQRIRFCAHIKAAAFLFCRHSFRLSHCDCSSNLKIKLLHSLACQQEEKIIKSHSWRAIFSSEKFHILSCQTKIFHISVEREF